MPVTLTEATREIDGSKLLRGHDVATGDACHVAMTNAAGTLVLTIVMIGRDGAPLRPTDEQCDSLCDELAQRTRGRFPSNFTEEDADGPVRCFTGRL